MDLHIERSFSGSVGSVVLGQSIRPSIRLRKSVNSCLLQHSLCVQSPRDFCTASCTHVAKFLQSPGREEGYWCNRDSSVLGLSNELKYKNKTPSVMWGGRKRTGKWESVQNMALSKSQNTALLSSHFLLTVLNCHHTSPQTTAHAQDRMKLSLHIFHQTCNSNKRYAIMFKSKHHLREQDFP